MKRVSRATLRHGPLRGYQDQLYVHDPERELYLQRTLVEDNSCQFQFGHLFQIDSRLKRSSLSGFIVSFWIFVLGKYYKFEKPLILKIVKC